MSATHTPPASLPTEMSLARITSQGLIPTTAAPDVAAAVSCQLAIQGRQVPAIPHALLVRAPTAISADVETASVRGDLVYSWPIRGTVHITTVDDHRRLHAALIHRTDAWVRRNEADYGVGTALRERVIEVALGLIGNQGLLRHSVLLAAWQGADLMEAFRGEDVSSYWRRHLPVRPQREGILVQGPRSSNKRLVMDMRSLPNADSGPAGTGVAHGGTGHRTTCAHIACCYATSYSPVGTKDPARWVTLPKTQVSHALEDATELGKEPTSAMPEDTSEPTGSCIPLVRAVAEGGARGGLCPFSPGESAPRTGLLYIRADLPGLMSTYRGAAQAMHFLGSFDELHVSYKDRLCLIDEDGERLICPASNSILHLTLVGRGCLIAVRPVGEDLLWKGEAASSARVECNVNRTVSRMEQCLVG